MAKANLDYLIFCDAASISKENKPILHGIFNSITSTAFPVVHPVLAVAFQITGDEVRPGSQVKLRLRNSATNADAFSFDVAVPPEAQNHRFGHVTTVVGLQFQAAGEYIGQVLINGNVVGSQVLEVKG